MMNRSSQRSERQSNERQSNRRRILFRVIIKVLTFLALAVLMWVFINSLFISKPSESETTHNKSNHPAVVSLDTKGMAKGDIRKVRWQGKEVAVLYRKTTKFQPLNNNVKQAELSLHSSLQAESRSQYADYFVYFNQGDSGNCPLFYNGESLKDVCSSKLFNATGREKNNLQNGYKIKIPPHYFENKKIIFGLWAKGS